MTRKYVLPWPPSTNYRVRNGRFLSADERRFRADVEAVVWCARYGEPLSGKLELFIDVYEPDRRKRDLDNLLKATLDAMSKAGAYDDDSQICRLAIVRKGIEKPGQLVVRVKEIR